MATKKNNINSANKPEYPMRINKYLAHKGYSTRRGADELIEKKLVFLNGNTAKLGDKVCENDVVEVRKKNTSEKYVYFAFNKPAGIVTHSPQNDEKDILSIVPIKGIFPVGRLDKNSEGLIILTNDGRITDRLLNPDRSHEKEYIVHTKEKLRSNFKERMESGVQLEDFVTKPCKIKILGDHSFAITLTEGKKHQIRRMVVALWNEVTDLKRTRILNIELNNLASGSYREIKDQELETFLISLGLR